MNQAMNATLRYDKPTIALHWLTAALVLALWCLGQTIDWFPKGDARITARSMHIVLGVALGLVLAARIAWRFGGGAHLAAAGEGWQATLGTLTHRALYLLLIGTVLLGLANTWIRGDTLFKLFTLPAFDPGNKSLRETVEELHGLAANVLLFVALFHAAAGLMHHYVFKDDVLRRMLPARSRRDGSPPSRG